MFSKVHEPNSIRRGMTSVIEVSLGIMTYLCVSMLTNWNAYCLESLRNTLFVSKCKKKKASRFHRGCRDGRQQRGVDIEGGAKLPLPNPIHVVEGTSLVKNGLIGGRVCLPVDESRLVRGVPGEGVPVHVVESTLVKHGLIGARVSLTVEVEGGLVEA